MLLVPLHTCLLSSEHTLGPLRSFPSIRRMLSRQCRVLCVMAPWLCSVSTIS